MKACSWIFAVCCCIGFADDAVGAQRPNILYIMSDDHAAHAISAYGSVVNQTPNLDRLAKEGMRFERCFAVNSICTPSRATILTGKYSHKNGVRYLIGFMALNPRWQNICRGLGITLE